MKRMSVCVMLTALSWAAPAGAVPIFNLLPPDGAVAAAPGETAGWGYEIVNDDLTQWLVVSSLAADSFANGTGSDMIFDFPILAPGASLIRSYVPASQGLYDFTWDLTAPAGFVNSGTFRIGAEFWDGDPFAGGQFASTLPDFTADYSVAVSEPSARVPEPGTLLLVAAGIAAAGLSRRKSA